MNQTQNGPHDMQRAPRITAEAALWVLVAVLALVLRLIFILIGAELLDRFHVTFYAFGLLLVYTAWKLARHDDEKIPAENAVVATATSTITIGLTPGKRLRSAGSASSGRTGR